MGEHHCWVVPVAMELEAMRSEMEKLQEELRVARLASHAGQSCEMLAARLVLVEKERDMLARYVNEKLPLVTEE